MKYTFQRGPSMRKSIYFYISSESTKIDETEEFNENKR